jgi:hypothetical protein
MIQSRNTPVPVKKWRSDINGLIELEGGTLMRFSHQSLEVFLVIHYPIPGRVLGSTSAYSSRNIRSPMDLPDA